MKKHHIIFIISAIIVIIGIVTYHFITLPYTNQTQTERVEQVKTTSLGDEFKYIYKYESFLNKKSVIICDKAGESNLATYSLNDNENDPNLSVVFNDKNIRCYEVKGQIIYTIDNSKFSGMIISMIAGSVSEENPSLVIITKSLFQTKEWKWIKACAVFLVKSGDNEVIQTLTRYAQGSFTQAELDINSESDIMKSEIQEFSKSLLQGT